MAVAVQRRRGSTTETSSFIGLTAEITVDLNKSSVVVHDGVTAGGHPLALETLSTSPVFVGDTGSGGTKGLVPAPATGAAAANKFLNASGSWASLPNYLLDVNHQNVLCVSKNGSDSNSGTFGYPFLTIQHAVNTATTGQVIIIEPGIYTENITITNNTLMIKGSNPYDYSVTRIDGLLTVSTTSSLFLSDIMLRNPNTGTTDYCLYLNDTADCRFENVGFIKPNLSNAIKIVGSTAAQIIFTQPYAEGIFDISSSQQKTVKIFQMDSSKASITIDGNSSVYVENCPEIGTVTHFGGFLYLSNIGFVQQTGGYSVVCSAASNSTNFLIMNNVNLQQTNLSYGLINQTGTCTYAFNNVNRNVTNDVLSGTRYNFSMAAADINSNRTSVNYTATDVSVKSHLDGIDTQLGLKANTSALTTLAGTIPAAQVNSDWNATSGVAQILNKPTYGNVVTYNAGFLAGNVPYLDSGAKLNINQIPDAALSHVYSVASVTAMNALSSIYTGDIALVVSPSSTYVYNGTTWQQLSSAGAVSSVNTQTGAVVLTASNISANRTPTNYTTTGTDIKANLDGIDAALGGSSSGVIYKNVNVITAAGPLTLSYTTSSLIIIKLTTPAAFTLNLPSVASVAAGVMFIVKDGAGNSQTYNITILPNGTDTIDGQSSVIIKNSYDSLTIVSNGTSWNLI